MKTIITKKYAASKGPKMDTLKKNKVSLTAEERKEVMDRGATWGQNDEIPAVWKSVVDDKEWFVCNTHRAFQCKPTLKGAINSYKFIETTASNIIITTKSAQQNIRPGSIDDVIQIYSEKYKRSMPYKVLVIYDFSPPFLDQTEPRIDIMKILNKANQRDIIKYVDETSLCKITEKIKNLELSMV